jgi:phosphatidylinositol-3-phosphatase
VRIRPLAILVTVAALTGCSKSQPGATSATSARPTAATSATSATTATTVGPVGPRRTCGNAGAPARHQKVVVFSFENRTWSAVGGTRFESMPYLHSLAMQCPTFADYTEPDRSQDSATQYVGTTQGSNDNTVRDDCTPSSTCSSLVDNVFRQVRVAGMTPRSYVEGATTGCGASGNAAKHIPALYFRGTYADRRGTHNDQDFCITEVRPYSELDPNDLPDFAFVTPTLCNDGHNCSNPTVDAWAKANIQPVLDSTAYRKGRVTVFVWYDEDHPVPNMEIGLHAVGGVKTTPVDFGAELKAWESLLGVPCLANACAAADMRSVAGI